MSWDAAGFCERPGCLRHLSECQCRGAVAERKRRSPAADPAPSARASTRNEPPPMAPITGTGLDGAVDDAAKRLDELRGALLDSAALDTIPPPQPVIDGYLYRNSLAWLHGKPGHGKSFVALDWAGCVSTGLPWQMHETTQGTVLYLIAEGTPGLQRRVRAWEDYTGHTMLARFLPIAVQLLDPPDTVAFTRLAAELQPSLLVIDTQARVTLGLEENSARDMGRVVEAVDRLRAATRACVLLVHHEARGTETMRGSTALEGAATSILRASRDGGHITLATAKQKDIAEPGPLALRLVPRLDSAVIMSHDQAGAADDLAGSQAAILAALRDSFAATGAPGSRLLEVSGMRRTTFYRSLNRLAAAGLVINAGTRKRPHWELPASRITP